MMVGLRPMFFISFGLACSGIFLIALNKYQTEGQLTTFMMLARFGASMGLSGASIATMILIPTRIVSTAIGVCCFVAAVFSFFAPMVAELPAPYPMIVLLVLMTFSWVASLFLSKERTPDDDEFTKEVLSSQASPEMKKYRDIYKREKSDWTQSPFNPYLCDGTDEKTEQSFQRRTISESSFVNFNSQSVTV